MTGLVGYLVLFAALAVFFLFIHLVIGRFIRPVKPDADKLTIYECGEPTIGSAWIQFDLRFYVVALLFVIFDVEVAFFFPWAVVFGKTNDLANTPAPQTRQEWKAYKEKVWELIPDYPKGADRMALYKQEVPYLDNSQTRGLSAEELDRRFQTAQPRLAQEVEKNRDMAREVGWFTFWDILVFFGVLLMGFAYLWRRGDLDWVRSTAAEKAAQAIIPGERADSEILVGAGRSS
jgi:NADH-quinone oxidoreductase subunit A